MRVKFGSLLLIGFLLVGFQCLAQDNALQLQAPNEVMELWKQWNGKYALFVHKEAKINKFKDLDGKVLNVAWINSDDIFGDAQSFSNKSGVKLMVAIQNNPNMYEPLAKVSGN
jgi:hypothetical protein